MSSAGCGLPWKRLRDAVLCRYQREKSGAASADPVVDAAELGCRALAEIPESYLSQDDEFVRLPETTQVERKRPSEPSGELGRVLNGKHSLSPLVVYPRFFRAPSRFRSVKMLNIIAVALPGTLV